MSKVSTIDFNAQNDVLLKDRKGVIGVAGRELTFRQSPEWGYYDPCCSYSFEACVIEESIVYFRKTGELDTQLLEKAQIILQTIISSFPPEKNLYLIYNLAQLQYPFNPLIRTKLNKFTEYFSQYCQNTYFLLPTSDPEKTRALSGKHSTLVSSVEDAIEDCLRQEKQRVTAGLNDNFLAQDLEKLQQKELMNTVKHLQDANQHLKQGYEQRMVEVLKLMEKIAGGTDSGQKTLFPANITATEIAQLISTIKQDIQDLHPAGVPQPPVHRYLTDSPIPEILWESEEQFRIISQNSQDLVYLLQQDGNIIYASPSVYNFLGYSPEEIIDHSYLNLIHPDDTVGLDKVFGAFLSGKAENKWNLRIRSNNGHYTWMEVNTKIITDTCDGQHKILLSSRNITEIKEVIEKLTESQEQLRSTFSSIDDDVYVFDKAHKLIASNIKPGKTGLLSVSDEECQGKSYRDIFPETLTAKLETALEHIAETQEAQQFEHCLSDHPVSFFFKLSVNYRQDCSGRYSGFTMVARDITEEKIADKKIIESERKYRSVVDSVREVIFQTDVHGKWSFLNPAWKGISGNDIFASLEQPVINFIHQDDRACISQIFEDIIQGKKEEAKCEVRFISSRNKVFWAEMFVKIYLSDYGKVAGTAGTLNDITKRKIAEETLRQSNQLLESINKNIKEAIIRINYHKGLVYFNKAFQEMFGYGSDKEVRELPVNVLFAQQKDLKIYTNILRDKKSLTNKTILFRRKDGSTFWGLSSFILIKDEDGNEIYDGAIRDITDRKEAEKKLKEKNQELIKTNEELDRFVYSASHDLRAPLASTLGLINISRIAPEEKERAYYLDLMEQSLNRMDKIIQDLTDYSRNARLEIETEEIDFEAMIKDVLQRLKYLKTIEDVRINTKIAAKDNFYSDKIRLYVIMINLLSNSIKYHKYDQANPFIHINITIQAKEAIIEVTDNGIGIDKNHIDKIFTMFFQVSRDSIGSGLGLYIAKETINKLNGSIMVKSTVNKGSTFTVTLPNAKTYGYEAAG